MVGRPSLRFAHEMNGDWYPWSVRSNGGSPELYVEAYRHVRALFASAGATNVRWVWSPNAISYGEDNALRASFPGVEHVDVIGVDGYNRGSTDSLSRWQSPQELFEPTLATLEVLAPDVPVWINETGCSSVGGDEVQWVSDLFDYLRRTKVSAVVWFEIGAKDGSDWRVFNDKQTQAAVRAALEEW